MFEMLKGYAIAIAIAVFGVIMVGVLYPLVVPSENIRGLFYGYCILLVGVLVVTIAWTTFKDRRFILLQLRGRRKRKELIDSEFRD